MYEIVVRFRLREEVMEEVDTLEMAQLAINRYLAKGYRAYYRAKVQRVAA